MSRIKLKNLIIEDMGPFFTQDPSDSYARPKLNKADHNLIQTYINYALGRYKKDYLKVGTELTLSRLYELIRKAYRDKGETLTTNTSKLERWFNGHDIIHDQIPLQFDFDTKKIKIVKLEDGISAETERQKQDTNKTAGTPGM